MYLSSNKLLYSAFGLALTLQFSFPDQVLGMNEGSDEFSSASTPHPQSPPPSSETFLGMNDGDDGFASTNKSQPPLPSSARLEDGIERSGENLKRSLVEFVNSDQNLARNSNAQDPDKFFTTAKNFAESAHDFYHAKGDPLKTDARAREFLIISGFDLNLFSADKLNSIIAILLHGPAATHE